MAGAFRTLPPALALTILDPKLSFSEADTQRSVQVCIEVDWCTIRAMAGIGRFLHAAPQVNELVMIVFLVKAPVVLFTHAFNPNTLPQDGVALPRVDGSPLDPHDLKRLQVWGGTSLRRCPCRRNRHESFILKIPKSFFLPYLFPSQLAWSPYLLSGLLQ